MIESLKRIFNRPWIKQAGMVGFWVLLIKGLVWLVILVATMFGLLGNNS